MARLSGHHEFEERRITNFASYHSGLKVSSDNEPISKLFRNGIIASYLRK
jgi:hypothetical protein